MFSLHRRAILPMVLFSSLLLAWWTIARNQTQPSHYAAGHEDDSIKHLRPSTLSNKTVNLVIASMAADDVSWTAELNLPNLNIIRYIIDAPEAAYRPPVTGRGREALVYHTYFYEFYDNLPDVSIMIHPHEDPWHIEGVLQQSMLFTLSQLDLDVVQCRQYANLRVSWTEACPDWINTTKTPEAAAKKEEPYMHSALVANFGMPDNEVPEIMAGPCCSQFAVTREAVQKNSRQQYKRSIDWIVDTSLSDYISGRTWEHMWPYLFKRQAIDCPSEWEVYCAMYHVCFEDRDAPADYNQLWREKNALKEDTEFWREIVNPQAGVRARKRMKELDLILQKDIAAALERGAVDSIRATAGGVCDA